MQSQSRRSSEKIDFSNLGFEIIVPTSSQPSKDECEQYAKAGCTECAKSLGIGDASQAATSSSPQDTNDIGVNSSHCDSHSHGDISHTNQHHAPSSASKISSTADIEDNDDGNGPLPNITIEPEYVSDLDVFDDDSSYGSEYSTDADGPPPQRAPTRARQLDNHKFATTGRRRSSIAVPDLADLGYGETPDLGYGSTPDLGYAPTKESLGYDGAHEDGCNRRSSAVQLVSVKGQVPRNRRASNLSRRSNRLGRLSTCSGNTSRSSMSHKSGDQARRRHSKSRSSYRERMVTRSVSRRLSRKHPAQVEVVRRASTATGCRGCHDHEGHEETAMKQTLQDLGCSELILDPTRQRVPRRVSMEYNNHDAGTVSSSHRPRSVCVDFGDTSSMGTLTSRRTAASRTMRPKRVSIGYVQREQTENEETGQRRVLSRRGSLDFSVGTSTLPRRGSVGKGTMQCTPELHCHQHCPANIAMPRRNSCSRQMALSNANMMKNATQRRRASMGAVPPMRNHSDSSSGRWGDRNEEDEDRSRASSRTPRRTPSGDSDKSLTSRRSSLGGGSDKSLFSRRSSIGGSDKSLFSRRTSIAHIPRKQIGKPQHRLSIKHVGNVEYLTRDSLVGRTA